MTQSAIPKLCPVLVRGSADIEKCGAVLTKGVCPNKDAHLNPMVSGFCNSGWHEGTRAKTVSGAAAPTCKNWLKCPCDCHTKLSKMFSLTGQPRILVDNSDYRPDRNTFTMVSRAELVIGVAAEQEHAHVVESPAPGIVPTVIEKEFTPTPTGRAARGELEKWVREVTDVWAVEGGANCTPQFVSEEIARSKGIKQPSTGAVDAVFKRWASIGFALIGVKPARFTGYTPEGIQCGLEVMKAKAKRGHKA